MQNRGVHVIKGQKATDDEGKREAGQNAANQKEVKRTETGHAQGNEHRIPVIWDGATRLFHWLLVASFLISVYTAFEEKEGLMGQIHLVSGYLLLSLLVWRLLWGVWGNEPSLFKNFPLSEDAFDTYGKSLWVRVKNRAAGKAVSEQNGARYGHNPFGALSVLLMLGFTGVQTLTGLFVSDGVGFAGPFAPFQGGFPAKFHAVIAYIMMGVVGFHIVAALFYQLFLKVPVITAIVRGQPTCSLASNSEPEQAKDRGKDVQTARIVAAKPRSAGFAALLALPSLLIFAVLVSMNF